jgi:hypothetical protein
MLSASSLYDGTYFLKGDAIVAKAQRGPDSLKPLLKRFTANNCKQVHVLQTTKTDGKSRAPASSIALTYLRTLGSMQ